MKKVFAFICMAAMSVTMLAGCGGSSSSSQAEQTQAQTQAEKAADTAAESPKGGDGSYTVGVVQMIENGAFNDMREGFIQELRDKGYTEDKLKVDYKCAQGDASTLQTIAQNMADGDYDLIATIATPATQALVNLGTDKPVIFIAVSAPVAAGIMSDLNKPDKNATGTSNAIPVSDIFGLAKTLTPDAKTYGFIYTNSEVNSVDTISSAKKYCDENGLKYVEASVTNSSEVQQAAQSLVGKVDAIFVPNDSVVMDSFSAITEVSRDNKIPVYGSSATMVNAGAFATVAISDEGIGRISADMAVDVLGGKKPADIPCQVVPASDTVINKQTLDALGIELPSDVSGSAVMVEDQK